MIKVTHYGEDYATVKVGTKEFETSISLGEALTRANTKTTKAIKAEIKQALEYLKINGSSLDDFKDAIFDNDYDNALINYGFYLGAKKALGIVTK